MANQAKIRKIYKEIHILCGLPGSGKSTMAQEICNTTKAKYVNVDYYMPMDQFGLAYSEKNIRRFVKETLNNYLFPYYLTDDYNVIYIDGLFLTTAAIHSLISAILDTIDHEIFPGEKYVSLKFIIEQWDENREACLKNDNYRFLNNQRDSKSAVTIKNSTYEMIDVDDLNKWVVSKLNGLQVLKPSLDKLTFEKVDHVVKEYGVVDKLYHDYNVKNGILKSDEWCAGGNWRSYDGRGGAIDADPQPDFDELDAILQNICPNISWLNYKYIMKHFVEVKEKSEDDYYGGTEYRHYYEARFNDIIAWLKENKLIDNKCKNHDC